MATVGSLVVDLVANTAAFAAGMDAVRGQIASLRRDANGRIALDIDVRGAVDKALGLSKTLESFGASKSLVKTSGDLAMMASKAKTAWDAMEGLRKTARDIGGERAGVIAAVGTGIAAAAVGTRDAVVADLTTPYTENVKDAARAARFRQNPGKIERLQKEAREQQLQEWRRDNYRKDEWRRYNRNVAAQQPGEEVLTGLRRDNESVGGNAVTEAALAVRDKYADGRSGMNLMPGQFERMVQEARVEAAKKVEAQETLDIQRQIAAVGKSDLEVKRQALEYAGLSGDALNRVNNKQAELSMQQELNRLQLDSATIGKTALEIENQRLDRLGLDVRSTSQLKKETLDAAKRRADINTPESGRDLASESRQMKLSLQTPAEEFKREIKRIKELKESAEADFSDDDTRKAVAEATVKLASRASKTGSAAALQFGTNEAFRSEVNQYLGTELMKRQLGVQERQLTVQQALVAGQAELKNLGVFKGP